jgi:RNA polymerase sigma-70 factor (ECF subfamily)
VRDATVDSEEEICRRLAEDLDGGFVDLVEAYGRVVLTVAARAALAREDAEDLAAEAFLRAYRALRRYSSARIRQLRVRPWLVTIVLNAARNDRRDAARRPRTGPFLAADEPISPARDPSERVEATAELGELAARLSALPAKQRIAVVLRHVVDLPLSEIALVLECPEGTARSHVARGLAALRAAYGVNGAAASTGAADGGTRR